MHLAGEPDAGDFVRFDFKQDFFQRCNGRLPPVFRALFRPAGFGGLERVFLDRFGDHFADLIDQDGFDPGCADVYADEMIHDLFRTIFFIHLFFEFLIQSQRAVNEFVAADGVFFLLDFVQGGQVDLID